MINATMSITRIPQASVTSSAIALTRAPNKPPAFFQA
jgi:hypothetical protein